MSRVDEALRRAESATGIAARERSAAQPDYESTAALFPSEGTVDSPQERQPRRPVETPKPSRRSAPTSGPIAIGAPKVPDDENLRARLVTATPNTASLEQYRRLAAMLHEEQAENLLKTVMITSALPSEGKTLTVANLALTLSESYGRQVLAIDADLRWPTLHNVLGVPNERGLSEALRDEPGELAFIEVSSHLSVLTAGKPGPTPLAGLASPRMQKVVADCAARFDWVLIDTSPVGVLPDAQVLVRLVGGVILVVGAGSTPGKAVESAIAELGGSEAILGVVLNRVEEHRIPAANYYGQYGTSTGRSSFRTDADSAPDSPGSASNW